MVDPGVGKEVANWGIGLVNLAGAKISHRASSWST
jgi:hypothetical protein